MASYQHDLFVKLINRLGLDSSTQKYLQNGLLTELVIHDQSKLWSFHITLTSILPYPIFETFMKKLNNTFKSLSIRAFIHVEKPKITGSLIKDYWPWIIHHSGLSVPLTHQLMADGHLKVTDNNVSLDTKDEALRGFLIDGALVQIEDGYHRIGFPTFKFHIAGGRNQSNLPAKLSTFEIKKVPSDVKLARNAVKALDHDASK